ncbi:uncharacterized protein MELLADRAFT_56018 [Melampsora larici-populina 98AG31]|uniref:Uncharacterized protein n=1 Tax=Melampsora larici-populina (strain 98AG31 / pathotype 3-4-7) TaxID=747676 RepID=F4RKP6_MELLP|nr:uncharacterized protein MELLADRAFT_56018 [Melampsora larici-populina 98AG31]EGG07139.1 hypothetical protein MELLADRAFT_56018 [Melampsora larici-populina 98AG31]
MSFAQSPVIPLDQSKGAEREDNTSPNKKDNRPLIDRLADAIDSADMELIQISSSSDESTSSSSSDDSASSSSLETDSSDSSLSSGSDSEYWDKSCSHRKET